MGGALTEALRQAEKALVELETGEVLASRASEMVAEFARLEHLAAAGRALCGARVAETKVWSAAGDKSPANWFARASGTSAGAAHGLLQAAEQMRELPEVAEAFRAGDLSSEQAVVIADAAMVAPGDQSQLVAAAGRLSMPELKEKARRLKHAARGESAEQRHERIHRNRYLRLWTDDEGAGRGSWSVTPDVQAEIDVALRPLRDRIFEDARRAGRREPDDAYGADAMAELARRALASPAGAGAAGDPTGVAADSQGTTSARSLGSRAKVIVLVSHAALLRGKVESGEVCEIAGIGPVPLGWAVQLMESDAFLAAAVMDGTDVRSVVHLGRRATVLQRTALEAMGPVCSVEGCGARARLQIDHRFDWAQTLQTILSGLDLLCPRHHLMKTLEGYRLAAGVGVRPFLSPEAQSRQGLRVAPVARSRGGRGLPRNCGEGRDGERPAREQRLFEDTG